MKIPSLYSMIIQSEDRKRTAIETLIYGLLICSGIVSIFTAAVQPVTVPSHLTANGRSSEYRA